MKRCILRRVLPFCILLLLLLSACGEKAGEAPLPDAEPPQVTASPEPIQTPPPTPTPTPEPAPEPTPELEPQYRNFLNGTPLEEPLLLRPFGVMVNNHIDAQPQCGIGNADIIYEVLAEGNITRMLCFYSDIAAAGTLGSIRSVRPYYQDICLSYGAVLCHAGGSEDAYSRISSMGIQNLDGVRGWYSIPVFYRDEARLSAHYDLEHTLFTDGQSLYDAAELQKYPLTVTEDYDCGLTFRNDAEPTEGEEAGVVEVNFNKKTTTLTFHEDSGLYTAEQYDAPYADGLTGEAVEFRNLLLLYANVAVIDDYGRLRVDLVGSGEGFYVCAGKRVPITWSKAGTYEPFHYQTAEGEDLTVCQGKTYIAILSPVNGTLTFS